MGGTAQYFYEEGIRYAYLDEPFMGTTSYSSALNEYMSLEAALPYTQIEYSGDGEPWESVTTIGVKWDETDGLETKLEKIITQKYIALFPLSTEAWAELRRTGYPKLFPVLNADDGDGSIEQGDMIRRIPWNASDPIVQQLVESSGIPTLGGPDMQSTRLWWDVDAPNF
jgi:hypothetical protein